MDPPAASLIADEPEGCGVQNASSLEHELANLHPQSFGWAVACCRYDRAEAEEVLQASYLKVLSGSARFAGKSAFKTWFFGVVRRTAAETRRRNFLRTLLFARLARLRPPLDSAAPETAEAIAVRLLLRRLAPRQRETLELVFYQDLSIEEAAQVMGISLGSARVHYQRGKKNLLRALQRGPG